MVDGGGVGPAAGWVDAGRRVCVDHGDRLQGGGVSDHPFPVHNRPLPLKTASAT